VLLQACLRQNPENRMAADYLLAYCLLDRQLERMSENLGRLNYTNKIELPRHVEEALLLSQLVAKKIDLKPFKIRPATAERFTAFELAYAPYQQNPMSGEAVLAAEFGETYWYYYIYGHSGSLLMARKAPSP
jgi:hypothetical protein